MPSFTGLVQIIKTPAGEAPVEVREAWVGLVLPCWSVLGMGGEQYGTVTKSRIPNRNSFLVQQFQAIDILEKERPEAAEWWKSHGYPHDRQNFAFREDEGRIVRGVTRQQIIHVEDDMQGDPYR